MNTSPELQHDFSGPRYNYYTLCVSVATSERGGHHLIKLFLEIFWLLRMNPASLYSHLRKKNSESALPVEYTVSQKTQRRRRACTAVKSTEAQRVAMQQTQMWVSDVDLDLGPEQLDASVKKCSRCGTKKTTRSTYLNHSKFTVKGVETFKCYIKLLLDYFKYSIRN
ncbi:uncharacterized protein V6R79_023353 [Siganus canaliculatus]